MALHEFEQHRHNTAIPKQSKMVKQSRYRPELAYRVDRGIALSFLDLGARRGWVVSTMSRLLCPQEGPDTHCTGGCVGLRVGLYVCEKSRPHRDFFCNALYLFPLLHNKKHSHFTSC
jgi:hypothetical protein